MHVQIDANQFDALQMEVGYAVAHEVHSALKRAGVPDGEQLQEIVAEALFNVGCILDGSAAVEGPNGAMKTVLTFRRVQHDGVLISAGGGSWIHEYAFGIAEDYFDRLRPGRAPPAPARIAERPPNPLAAIARVVREVAEAFTKP